MLTWLTPLPAEFTQQLQLYREQDWWFPFNLILPDSLGSISAIIGVQVLLVITLRSQQRIWREVILLTVTAATLTYFLGQPIARSFYEFLLWIAVGMSLSVNPEQISTTGIRALQFQSIAVLGMCGLGLWSLFPGVFSHSHREKVLHEAGYYYSAMDWANQNTNHDDVIASSLRSVAYLKTDFIPMDWEKLGIQNKNRAIYLKNMNYYLGSDCYDGFDYFRFFLYPLKQYLGEFELASYNYYPYLISGERRNVGLYVGLSGELYWNFGIVFPIFMFIHGLILKKFTNYCFSGNYLRLLLYMVSLKIVILHLYRGQGNAMIMTAVFILFGYMMANFFLKFNSYFLIKKLKIRL
jgi:hypothetical protein